MKIALPIDRQKRSGATLTEVLMSLLIFSIGIVSVFTLFPISLLSSIQATQLTNSKILADNVVELVRTRPGILHPPHPRDNTNYTYRGEWRPNTTYNVNDYILPRTQSGNLYPQPFLVYRCTTSGTSGGGEPAWLTNSTVNDGAGALEWQPVPLNAANDSYVVDPLGRHLAGDNTAKTFGSNNATLLTYSNGGLSRTDGSVGTFPVAQSLFSQPDSWTVVLEEIPSSINATSVSFPNNVDLGAISATNHRVIITSSDGKNAASRTISNKSGQTINLNGPNLPNELDSTSEVGRVRVEAFNPRYTYFLTVRRPGPFDKPTVTAVVVFNRSFGLDDEEVYEANFASNNNDPMMPEGFSGSTPINGILDKDIIRVAWDPSGATERAPLIREGNYVLDAKEALWYRIINVGSETTVGGKKRVDLTVDRSIEVRTPATSNASDAGRAIFMPGIVKVFEL